MIIFGAEIAAGVFGFINKEQVRHIKWLIIHTGISQTHIEMYCIVCILDQHQIVEEVQKFYSSSIADVTNPNGTAIALIYHKTVSQTSPNFPSYDSWQLTQSFYSFCFLHLQLNCCGGSTSDASTTLCADAPEETEVNPHTCCDTLYPHGGSKPPSEDNYLLQFSVGSIMCYWYFSMWNNSQQDGVLYL